LRFLLAAEGDAFLGGAAGVCVDLGEVELWCGLPAPAECWRELCLPSWTGWQLSQGRGRASERPLAGGGRSQLEIPIGSLDLERSNCIRGGFANNNLKVTEKGLRHLFFGRREY
jgi:hypothetical protein